MRLPLLLIFISILFSPVRNYAQDFTSWEYSGQVVRPQKNCVDVYNQLKKDKCPEGVTEEKFDRFLKEYALELSGLYNSGLIYPEIFEIEKYLNQVMDSIIGPSKPQEVHVYLVRDPSFNAFSYPDGSIFINIGLFAEIQNEASLASLLGHEYSHYKNKDWKGMAQWLLSNDKESVKFSNKNMYEKMHNNRQQELRCDSEGFIWSLKAGYDCREAYHYFNLFFIQEQKNKDQQRGAILSNVYLTGDNTEKTKTDVYTTHPEIRTRLDNLFKVYNKNNSSDLEKFKISTPEKFQDLIEKAKVETLNLLLTRMDFKDCAERAFSNYLIHPFDDTYVYFILESVRRMIYIDPYTATKGFLTEEYSKYFQPGQGILNNIFLLYRDSTTYQNIKATVLFSSDPVLFNTYQEAFNYFKEVAILKNIKECYLTIALYEKNEKREYKNYLNKYLSETGILHEAYARYITGNSKSLLPGKTVIFIDGTSKVKSWQLESEKIAEDNYSFLISIQDRLKLKYKENEYRISPDFAKASYTDWVKLNEAFNQSFILHRVQDQSHSGFIADLFMLDPGYYSLFLKHSISNLTIVSVAPDKGVLQMAYFSYEPAAENKLYTCITSGTEISAITASALYTRIIRMKKEEQ